MANSIFDKYNDPKYDAKNFDYESYLMNRSMRENMGEERWKQITKGKKIEDPFKDLTLRQVSQLARIKMGEKK